MKRMLKCGLAVMALPLLLAGCMSTTKEIKATVDFKTVTTYNEIQEQMDKSILLNSNRSGYDVFKNIYAEKPDENLLFSPLSLTCALSMLENGAVGQTDQEILEVLHLTDKTNMNVTYNGVINHFNSLTERNKEYDMPETILNMSNSFWFRNQGLKIKSEYINLIKSYFDGEVQAVDFTDEKTKDVMNLWIEEKTNHLLKDTIKKTNPSDVAYLINTLYFKGQWTDEFPEHRTIKQDFSLTDGTMIPVDMMHLDEGKSYFENNDCQIVALNYSDATMYVILPKDDLDSFFKETDYDTLNDMIGQMEYGKVNIHFPKFKYNNSTKLNDNLIDLGMPSSFDPFNADFSNMIEESNNNVFVSLVFQNTAIAVDEKGTEAAAVTVIAMNESAMEEPEKQYDFICDKPFMYIIRENNTQSDLFIGMVKDPTQ